MGLETYTITDLHDTYRLLYQIEKQKRNYESALIYLEKQKTIQDTLFNQDRNREISNLHTNYELDKKQQEITRLNQNKIIQEAESAKRGLIISLFAVSFIFLVAVSFVLYSGRSKEKYNNRLLNTQNKEISAQKQLLEYQKEEITAQATALREVNEEISGINETLEQKVQARTQQLALQNKQIADFAFLNAHKLRGSWARAMGLLYLLENNLSSDNYNQLLQGLKISLTEIEVIIREINETLDTESDMFEEEIIK